MEIPVKPKQLYKHWEMHSSVEIDFDSCEVLRSSLINEIEEFITERMLIWERKFSGQQKPYTKDSILSNFRFCNVYRELDRQTIEIHTQLKKFESDFELWLLNLAFSRFVCRTKTILKVGFLNFDNSNNKRVFDNLINLKRPKYGSAYVFPISVIQKSEYDTREKFFCFYLPKKIKEIASLVKDFKNTPVLDGLEEILPAFGFNFKFHWTEILIDIAYQLPGKINLFKDFYVGPGAIPTLKRISAKKDILNKLVGLRLEEFPYLTYEGKPVWLSAENWEGIACEFRKYTNLKNGEGRRRIYN